MGKEVYATKYLVENRKKVRFMYREKPDRPGDSGWRFFAGVEDHDYANNPNNIGIYSIETILEIDPSIEKHLNSEIGSQFEREGSFGVFKKY